MTREETIQAILTLIEDDTKLLQLLRITTTSSISSVPDDILDNLLISLEGDA